MKRYTLFLITLFCSSLISAQNTFKAVVKDKETGEALAGTTVLVSGTNNGGSANEYGVVEIRNIPDGDWLLLFSFVGYKDQSHTYRFPLNNDEQFEILMSADEEEMEEVIVTATRTSRTIDDIPTRVEAISGEELEEKGNMKPGDIRMMLNESTGIQTQQTSATSYNSSIRIQGLDGKYTQILRDGYPLYSGFSGGLGLLQIVPLDLKQVEVIKGASSTLYGGGAIAGLVNLVSKIPSEKREVNFLINATSALGLDVSGFYARKFEKIGTTVFASYNSGTPYDPAGIGLTAIPEFKRITLNPKLFIYFSPNTILDIGVNSTVEDRTGGDIRYIEGKGDSLHSYFEENETMRLSSQLGLQHFFSDSAILNIKNSISYYDRAVTIPDFEFSGIQIASFSEASIEVKRNKLDWVLGINLWTEQFNQEKSDSAYKVDYNHITYGFFAQNTWSVNDFFALETGIRADYQDHYGFFFLPRISGLFKLSPKLTARFGGGLGYKTPTIFTEDAERLQFKNVFPVDESNTKAEKSVGANFDINYRTAINDHITFSINNLLFYTRILQPLILTLTSSNHYEFLQPGGYIDTKGLEVNLKFTYNDVKLFIGYTLADVNQWNEGESTAMPLVAKHRLNNVLMYELHEKWKVGLEAYYYSRQKLNDGGRGQAYWIMGFMAEKIWENISVFINFENLLDTRQTRFDQIYTGTITNPVFRDIYAPVDGFVVNGGIKLRLSTN